MMTSTRRRKRPRRPGPPARRSIYDPIHFGIDENGHPVEVTLMYRNLLIGGEPGSGQVLAVATPSSPTPPSAPTARLWLFDGKRRRTRAVAPGR